MTLVTSPVSAENVPPESVDVSLQTSTVSASLLGGTWLVGLVSNPTVKPIEKPTRPTNHVPPKSDAETVEVSKPTTTDSGGTSSADTGNVTKVMSSESLAEVMKEKSLTSSLSLLSNDITRSRVSVACQSPNEPVADNCHYPTSSNLLSDDMQERDIQLTAVDEPKQPSCHQDGSLLQKELTKGKRNESEAEP